MLNLIACKPLFKRQTFRKENENERSAQSCTYNEATWNNFQAKCCENILSQILKIIDEWYMQAYPEEVPLLELKYILKFMECIFNLFCKQFLKCTFALLLTLFFLNKKFSRSFLRSDLFNVADSLRIHTFRRGITFLQFFLLPFCIVPVVCL